MTEKFTPLEHKVARAMLFGPHSSTTAGMTPKEQEIYFAGPVGDVALEFARAAIHAIRPLKKIKMKKRAYK